MITVQRALWLMRLGTLPSRNSLRPAMPALPTTSTSIACSSAALDDRHRRVVVDHDVRLPAVARHRSRMTREVVGGRSRRAWLRRRRTPCPRGSGTITCTMCSSAPNASANVAAQRTARSAVSDRSVADHDALDGTGDLRFGSRSWAHHGGSGAPREAPGTGPGHRFSGRGRTPEANPVGRLAPRRSSSAVEQPPRKW